MFKKILNGIIKLLTKLNIIIRLSTWLIFQNERMFEKHSEILNLDNNSE